MPDVTCVRCGQTRAGFERPPFPGAIGARVIAETCQVCWGDWLKQQTMLINHYGLNVMDPLRAFPDEESSGVPVQERRDRGCRHVETGNHQLVSALRMTRAIIAVLNRPVFIATLVICAGGCASSGSTSAATPSSTVTGASRTAGRSGAAWADSIIAAMSVRDRVRALVWPFILGDYVPEGSAEWDRIRRFVTEQHVGGFIISVGAPVDIAVKLNALQELSALPLVVSADMETGVGSGPEAPISLPNAIDLGGADVVSVADGARRRARYDAGVRDGKGHRA